MATELFKLFRRLVPERVCSNNAKIFEHTRVCLATVLAHTLPDDFPAVSKVRKVLCVSSRDPSKALIKPVWAKVDEASKVQPGEGDVGSDEDDMEVDETDVALVDASELQPGEGSQDASEVALFLQVRPPEAQTLYHCTLVRALQASEMVSTVPELSKKQQADLFKGEDTRVLRLVPPLSLKTSDVPVLTRNFENVTVACTARAGGCGDEDASLSVKLYDCVTGTEKPIDPHALAKKLSDQGVDIGATDDRVPEEVIAVCIDVSSSMGAAAMEDAESRARYNDTAPEVQGGLPNAEQIASRIASNRYFHLLRERLLRADALAMQTASYLLFEHGSVIPAAMFKAIAAALAAVQPAPASSSSLPTCPITGDGEARSRENAAPF